MPERPKESPVPIVVGGPVGLACALLLGRFDVPALRVARHRATSAARGDFDAIRKWVAATSGSRSCRRRGRPAATP
jgi:2-polyprenyl-6-methoxyphenol hydroxylase-like FAD-dependent oxidoreductase